MNTYEGIRCLTFCFLIPHYLSERFFPEDCAVYCCFLKINMQLSGGTTHNDELQNNSHDCDE